MKKFLLLSIAACGSLLNANAQTGNPYIHDPSTLVECDGKYYTFGTGGGGLISADGGWTWDSGAERPGGGAAPDAMKIGDRYLIAYGATGGGLGGSHSGRMLTMWNKTLDPKSPDFKFSEPVEVAGSVDGDDFDCIDPCLFLDPTTGRLWLTCGTYFGHIRLFELDPKTGKRVEGNKELDVAIDCEASALFYKDGWYYLLGTHGTCCDGVNSTYNIVCGRSKTVTGPYLDNVGRPMLQGGGKMVVKGGLRQVGAGHFGRTVVADGLEKMSFHWEADFERSGMSTLAIRPIVWKNGWPEAGKNVAEGVYDIESQRHGYSLELAVDFERLNVARRGGFGRRDPNQKIEPIANQALADVQGKWAAGEIGVRNGDFLARPHQQWKITPVDGVGGFLGQPYFKITINGTNRALAATADKEVTTVAEYTGAPEQLWQIDQLTDGTYRIMPKAIPGCSEKLCLISIADSTPTLGAFDFNSDNSKWQLNGIK
ncbi:MAG: family 43 glycosylhydrolase [Bacteroidaceae bacterium]|nr:family 43 glycosylhydrolase [Bacteroidaceae bacterium]